VVSSSAIAVGAVSTASIAVAAVSSAQIAAGSVSATLLSSNLSLGDTTKLDYGVNGTVGDTAGEATIYSTTVSASSITSSGLLYMKCLCDAREDDGAAPTLTVKMKLGSTTVCTIASVPGGAGASAPLIIEGMIANRDSESSQVGTLKVTTASGVLSTTNTSSEDTSSAKTLAVTVQWSDLPDYAESVHMYYGTNYVLT
jgi:hypothetical protein